MSKMSFLDKLGILVNLTGKYHIYLLVFLGFLIVGILLGFTNKKNARIMKIFYFLITVGIIIFMITSYHASLGNMFSYMMNNFFIAMYFPTIAIYLAAIIAMNIIVWISIFSFKSAKPIKVLNISVYVIMNYLMALLLKVINVKKLDIFDQVSLYGNKQATALIELSSIVFVVWIVFLILYKLILIYLRKDYKPKVKRIIVRKQIKKLPENYEPLIAPEMVQGNAPNSDKVIDLKGRTEEEVLLEKFSKQFTLEDYKLFSRLLKEEQERQKAKEEKPVEFVKTNEKVTRKVKEKKQKESHTVEEESYREQQKKEIQKMEEERRELLRKEKEKQQEEKKEQQALEVLINRASEEEKEQRKLTELEMLYR